VDFGAASLFLTFDPDSNYIIYSGEAGEKVDLAGNYAVKITLRDSAAGNVFAQSQFYEISVFFDTKENIEKIKLSLENVASQRGAAGGLKSSASSSAGFGRSGEDDPYRTYNSPIRLHSIDGAGKASVVFTQPVSFPDDFVEMVNSYSNETRLSEFMAKFPHKFVVEEKSVSVSDDNLPKSKFRESEEAVAQAQSKDKVDSRFKQKQEANETETEAEAGESTKDGQGRVLRHRRL